MGKQSTTPPVDYTVAAEKTAAGNLLAAKQTQAANMVNQTTPTGSVTYTPTYWNAQGEQIQAGQINPKTGKPYDLNSKDVVIRYGQNVELTPEQRALFEQGQRISQGLGDLAETKGMEQIRDALNNPLKSDIGIVSSVPTTAGEMVRGVEAPELQRSIQNNADRLVTSLQDPQLLQQETTDALYKANTQFLDPQFQRGQADLENKLANQGITPGSEAYNRAMQDFGNQKQQAYESARNQAIGGGMQAAQGMFGMGLQGGQFTNQALGQQFGQGATAANFANQAALQGFGAGMQNANLNNQVLQQLFGQNISAANLQNAASNQDLLQEQLRQQAPINIINALRSGQLMNVANIPNVAVSAPGQMANVAGADYLGAANAEGNYKSNMAQANAAQSAGMMQGIGSIAGAAMGMI